MHRFLSVAVVLVATLGLVAGDVDLMRVFPKHAIDETQRKAHYDFVTTHTELYRARSAKLSKRDLVISHQEVFTQLQNPASADYNAAHRFVLRISEQAGLHMELETTFGSYHYKIFNHNTAEVTTTLSKIEDHKSRHPDKILDYIPLLPEAKVSDNIMGTCTDYQRAKGRLSAGNNTVSENVVLDKIEDGTINPVSSPETDSLPRTDILVKTTAISSEDTNTLIQKIESATKQGLRYTGLGSINDGKSSLQFSFDGDADPSCTDFGKYVSIVSTLREVQWVEPQIHLVTFNRWAKGIIQTASSTYTPLHQRSTVGLTGQSVITDSDYQIIGVADTGVDMSSCYFYDSAVSHLTVKSKDGSKTSSTHRKIIQYITFADSYDDATEAHGTHVAGTVAGQATSTKSYGDFVKFNGMAPKAKLSVFDMGNSKGQLSSPSVASDLLPVQYKAGARIFTWSWGCAATSLTDTCGGAYTSNAQDTDEFLWDFPDAMVFIANGNTGQTPAGVPSTVGAPATAKNVVSVGASMTEQNVFKAFSASVRDGVNSNFDISSLAYFSSRGPCQDGRVKPEVTAPGWWITSAAGDANSTTMHCTIKTLQGTSMATPATAGMASLVRQYFTDGFYPSGSAASADAFTPSGALIKAVLIHGTQRLLRAVSSSSASATSIKTFDTSAALPNSDQGYGRVQLDRSLYFKTGSNLCSTTTNCPAETAYPTTGTTLPSRTHTYPSGTISELSYFVWGGAYRSGPYGTPSSSSATTSCANTYSGLTCPPASLTSPTVVPYVTEIGIDKFGKFFYFKMPSTASDLTVTLVWTDYPGNSGATQSTRQLINQLDVIVEGPCTGAASADCTNAWRSSLYYSSQENMVNPHARIVVSASELTGGGVYRIYVGPWIGTVTNVIGSKGGLLYKQPFALVASVAGIFTGESSNLKPYTSTDQPFTKYEIPGQSATYISTAATTLIAIFSVASAILGGLVGVVYFSHKQAARLEDEEVAQRIGAMMQAQLGPRPIQ